MRELGHLDLRRDLPGVALARSAEPTTMRKTYSPPGDAKRAFAFFRAKHFSMKSRGLLVRL